MDVPVALPCLPHQQNCFTMILKFLTVAALATFEIYAAIPAGFAMGLSPFLIFLASVVGGLAGVFIATFLGDKLRKLFYRKRNNKPEKPKKTNGFAHRIWERYGLAGLGVIGTITVGGPISIGVGVGLNIPLYKMLIWCCIGVVIRCILFTTLGHYGSKLF